MSEDASILPGQRIRARGARTNRAGRFEATDCEAFDDGWDLPEEERLIATEVRFERPRSAISWNRSPDLPFDRSINPYRGCEHGCIYCYARPSHAFLNLSPGLDFETRLIARPGIAEVLEVELRRPAYRPRAISIGTNTDPYQPVERDHGLMRQLLKVLAAFRHPVWITTRGTLIERDIDLIAPMAAEGLASVSDLGHHAGRGPCPQDGTPCARAEAEVADHPGACCGGDSGPHPGLATDPCPDRPRA